MNSSVEHFCTLFDKNYLPLGMTLHSSLMEHAQPFHLWVLCMDKVVEAQLKKLALPNTTTISLSTVETPELLGIKEGRSRGEYCWTLTPFTFQMVFDRDKTAQRVTYLDADLFFFDNPNILLQELTNTRKHVLITDHGYDPRYDQSAESGQFCVQFVTFNRSPEAFQVMHKWQAQCVEWCFNRHEQGRFGDQKYLDTWPIEFNEIVHIFQAPEKTLAPWNVKFYAARGKGKLSPVFYHFHGLRFLSPKLIRLYTKYKIGTQGKVLYDTYKTELSQSLKKLSSTEIPIPSLPEHKSEITTLLRYIKQIALREADFFFLKTSHEKI